MPNNKIAELMKELPSGGTLEIKATDIGFKTDILAWCKSMKHELLDMEEEQGIITATLRKR